jgi:LPS export ABC transporter protein LptC
MGVKIFAVILALFAAELLFLATKEPKKLDISKEDINYTTIEFIKLNGYRITKEGIKDSLQAKKAQKFKDFVTLDTINAHYLDDDNISHKLSSKIAKYKNDILELKKSVKYENNKTLTITTDSLIYDIKNKIAVSKTPFVLKKDNMSVFGDSFRYNIKDGIIRSINIRYLQEVDE